MNVRGKNRDCSRVKAKRRASGRRDEYLCARRAVQPLAALLASEAALVPFLAVGAECALGKVDGLVASWTLGHRSQRRVEERESLGVEGGKE